MKRVIASRKKLETTKRQKVPKGAEEKSLDDERNTSKNTDSSEIGDNSNYKVVTKQTIEQMVASIKANDATFIAAKHKAALNSAFAIDFVDELGKEKLALRTKTHVQLQIVDEADDACQVVVSGGMDLKNLGQLLAFLTGHSQDYNWHSQKGKSLKESAFSLVFPIEGGLTTTVTFADKKMSTSMTKDGHKALSDKSVKIAQIFQGLTIGPETGIVYDSELASKFGFIWTPTCERGGKRYEIQCKGIVSNKCILGKKQPLPRVVNDYVEVTDNAEMALNGKSLYKTNDILRGNRSIQSEIFVGGRPSKAFLRERANRDAAKPVVNWNDGATLEYGKEASYMDRKAFDMKLVKSAGLPPSVH